MHDICASIDIRRCRIYSIHRLDMPVFLHLGIAFKKAFVFILVSTINTNNETFASSTTSPKAIVISVLVANPDE